MLVVGRNGVGKTNLLESLHLATQGFSPRTRQDAQLIRFGESAARVVVTGTRGALAGRALAHAARRPGEGGTTERRAPARRPSRCAARSRRSSSPPIGSLSSREGLRPGARTSTACSRASPLRVPACRRTTSRRWRSATPRCAVCNSVSPAATRSRRGRSASPRSARARRRAATRSLESLGPGFADRAGELGLPEARLGYDAIAPTVEDARRAAAPAISSVARRGSALISTTC